MQLSERPVFCKIRVPYKRQICGGNMRKSTELYILWSELSSARLTLHSQCHLVHVICTQVIQFTRFGLIRPTPPPIKERSIAMSVSVCLSVQVCLCLCVCLSAIISSELHVRSSPCFYACYLWPLLSPPVAAW